jgi:hypothetical protein
LLLFFLLFFSPMTATEEFSEPEDESKEAIAPPKREWFLGREDEMEEEEKATGELRVRRRQVEVGVGTRGADDCATFYTVTSRWGLGGVDDGVRDSGPAVRLKISGPGLTAGIICAGGRRC